MNEILINLEPLDIFISLLHQILIWLFFALLITLIFAIPASLTLLRSSRARGKGINGLFLADRFILIWLSKNALPSNDVKVEMYFKLGSSNAAPSQSNLDKQLEKWRLVNRFNNGNTYQVKTKTFSVFLPYRFTVYLITQYSLVLIFGDSRNCYKAQKR